MKLLAAISHHGLGHLAQAGPVLAALHALAPDLALTVWSGLGTAALGARIPFAFAHRPDGADVGLPMHDAVRVDLSASRAAYAAFHADWDRRVAAEAGWLQAQGFAAVFSDVAYLPLAAAARAGLPAIALCSLNWRDVAGAYLPQEPGMATVLAHMQAAYLTARAFLRPAPAMPMAWLPRSEAIAPIAARGRDRRADIARQLGARAATRWVLVGFGGIGYRRPLPELPGVTWLAPDGWEPGEGDPAQAG